MFNTEVLVHDKVNRIFLSQRFPIRDVRVSGLAKLEEISYNFFSWFIFSMLIFCFPMRVSGNGGWARDSLGLVEGNGTPTLLFSPDTQLHHIDRFKIH